MLIRWLTREICQWFIYGLVQTSNFSHAESNDNDFVEALLNFVDLIFFRMYTVYHKVNANIIMTLLTYDDYIQIQICINKTCKVFKSFMSPLDVKCVTRFIRDQVLELDKLDV